MGSPNSIFLYMVLFCASWFVSIAGLQAQKIYQGKGNLLERESLSLFTDRTVYAAGETVFFSTEMAPLPILGNPYPSKVLYVELFRNQVPLLKGKFPILNGKTRGSFWIPQDLPSGHYGLRVYTQLMRNYGFEIFPTLNLTVVNAAHMPGPDFYQNSGLEENEVNWSPIQVKVPQKRYPKRAEVQAMIVLPETIESINSLVISVVKEGSLESFGYWNPPVPAQVSFSSDEIYLPDIRDVGVHGQLLDSLTRTPVPNHEIFVSLLGDSSGQVHMLKSDDHGNFVFPLYDLAGIKDVLVSSKPLEGQSLDFAINREFSTDFPKPGRKAIWEESDRHFFEDLLINHQIEREFHQERFIPAHRSYPLPPLLGNPSQSIRLEDYIRLPNIQEVFTEIVPFATLRRKGEGMHLEILNESQTSYYQDALLLVDYIPVFDLSELLQLNPDLIDRIDVWNRPYLLGDFSVKGMVLVHTKAGNYAGMALPKPSALFDYQTLQDCVVFSKKSYSEEARKASLSYPDFRNVLYWDPAFEIKSPANKITFLTSDAAGTYEIIVRGVDHLNRKYYLGSEKIMVE